VRLDWVHVNDFIYCLGGLDVEMSRSDNLLSAEMSSFNEETIYLIANVI